MSTHGERSVGKVESGLPLLKGTLELLILKTLSWQPMHGYGIASFLEQRSEGALGVDDSALYQALQRLELRGAVNAEWGITENNRRARYYRMTTAGRRQLRADVDVWTRYARSVGRILALTRLEA